MSTPAHDGRPVRTALDGRGISSYLDLVILRDSGANTDRWDQADGTLEERVYLCHSNAPRPDVVALISASGQQVEQVRYSATGRPFAMRAGDLDSDGDVDIDDVNAWGAGGYDVLHDLDLDGSVTSADFFVLTANAGAAGGWGVLSDVGNRKGYSGYEFEPVTGLWDVRHRWLHPDLGRWLTRDPLGYVDGPSLYEYVAGRAVVAVDPMGMAMGVGSGGGGSGCSSQSCGGHGAGGTDAGVMGYVPAQPNTTAPRPQQFPPAPWAPWPGCNDSMFCYNMYQRVTQRNYNEYTACAGSVGSSFGTDLLICIGGCFLISVPAGPALAPAFGACMATCTGISAMINLWVFGKCWDAFYKNQRINVNMYCLCLNKRGACSSPAQRKEDAYLDLDCAGSPIPRLPNTPYWPEKLPATSH